MSSNTLTAINGRNISTFVNGISAHRPSCSLIDTVQTLHQLALRERLSNSNIHYCRSTKDEQWIFPQRYPLLRSIWALGATEDGLEAASPFTQRCIMHHACHKILHSLIYRRRNSMPDQTRLRPLRGTSTQFMLPLGTFSPFLRLTRNDPTARRPALTDEK